MTGRCRWREAGRQAAEGCAEQMPKGLAGQGAPRKNADCYIMSMAHAAMGWDIAGRTLHNPWTACST